VNGDIRKTGETGFDHREDPVHVGLVLRMVAPVLSLGEFRLKSPGIDEVKSLGGCAFEDFPAEVTLPDTDFRADRICGVPPENLQERVLFKPECPLQRSDRLAMST